MRSQREIRNSSLALKEKLKNRYCVICDFPMKNYTSIWYDLDDGEMHAQCVECYTLYDGNLEIELPGLVNHCGEA